MDSIPSELMLPTNLGTAIDLFRQSEFAINQFGAEFVRIFADNKAAHLAEYQHAVTDWEVRRFLEMA
jgi:glutamine synthetase